MDIEEKIKHEKEILLNQINGGNGYFALYVLKTFKFIKDVCQKNNTNWCLESKIPDVALLKYMYSSVYGGKPDHMGWKVLEEVKSKLVFMGYIEFKEVNGEKRIYILKDIEFCDYEDYIHKNATPYRAEQVYRYLKENGIYIFKYEKNCFKCQIKIPIYSYYLGKQLENELGKRYKMENFNIPNRHLFDTVGIGEIEKIDEYLMQKIPTIKRSYSKMMECKYVVNTCPNCGVIQGINYTVYKPKELENLTYEELKKKIWEKVDIDVIGLTEKEIRKYL